MRARWIRWRRRRRARMLAQLSPPERMLYMELERMNGRRP